MAGNVRRRGARRLRKKGNWFTRMKTWKKVLLCFTILLICLLGTGIGYVYAKWSKVDTRVIEPDDIIINAEVRMNKEIDLGEGYTNIALFGVDSRDGNLGEGNRTDCIIIASLNNETKEIKLVSVYRDTLLDLSEGTYQKCNAAYSYGGPVLAINMLNMNLDLDIEDYVTVDFGAIADAIDLLGGIELDITDEEAGYLNEFLQETADSAGKEAHFLSGGGHLQLDGTQATTYARIRSTAGGDFTRTERQRIVLEKMFEKAKTADLATLNNIIDQVFPQVSTSFTLQEILTYAAAYSEYTLSENRGFPFDNYLDMLSEVGSVVIPDDLVSNVTQLHEFLFGTVGYTPSSVVQTVNSNIIYTANSAGTSSSAGAYDSSGAYYDDSGAYGDSTYSDSGYYDDGSGYYDDDGSGYYDDTSGGYGDGTGSYGDGTVGTYDESGGYGDGGMGGSDAGYVQDGTAAGSNLPVY